MRAVKCKYCGKSYASPSEMLKRKCHSHPKGAWAGCCTPDQLDELRWGIEKKLEDSRKAREEREKREKKEAEFLREYKTHTPLLDYVLNKKHGEDAISETDLMIRYMDLNCFAVDLANGINAKTRDAINTIYALRAGCDYVLNNVDAQKEGSLSTWLDEIKQLKDEVVSWDFWVIVYWLSKPVKAAEDKDWENKKWSGDSIAGAFHKKQVIPMLHAVNKKGDEKEKEVKLEIERHIVSLMFEKSAEKGFDPEQLRIIKTLLGKVNDYSFWGILYCLYWMKLCPTPWNDQKVWPIPVARQNASKPNVPSAQQTSTVGSSAEIPPNIQRGDFVKKLCDAYSNNCAPFKKLWIYRRNTLVFDDYLVGGRVVSIDVAVLSDMVDVFLYARNGTLNDLPAVISKNDVLKKLFPAVKGQRMLHSNVAYAEVSGFIDRVLAALRVSCQGAGKIIAIDL